jgi:hypothetical protein
VTHSLYARAPDLTVTLYRIAVQYLTLFFHQHTEAKDVITSKRAAIVRITPNEKKIIICDVKTTGINHLKNVLKQRTYKSKLIKNAS